MANDQPTTAAGAKALPSFEKPPLEEVVFAIQFEPLKAFTASHPGLFYALIRDRYPFTETHRPLQHQKELPEMAPRPDEEFISLPLIPRSWFVSQDKTELLQLQRDFLIRNWRRVEGSEEYPRFPYLRDKLKQEWASFVDFVEKENLGELKIDQCELTYINHIDKGQGWDSFAEMGKVFSFVKPASRSGLLAEPETLSWSGAFKLPNGRGRLSVEMSPAFRGRDFKMILALTIKARGAPASHAGDDAFSWFDLAHEWVVGAFDDVTEPTMHSLWKKTP